ncbi:hypothetical protein Tco_0914773 [Tanacetum coccineum]
MQRLICIDGEKGENHSSLCVLAMKAWLGLGRYGGTEKDMKVSTRAAIRVVQRVVSDCVNGEGSTVRVKLVDGRMTSLLLQFRCNNRSHRESSSGCFGDVKKFSFLSEMFHTTI